MKAVGWATFVKNPRAALAAGAVQVARGAKPAAVLPAKTAGAKPAGAPAPRKKAALGTFRRSFKNIPAAIRAGLSNAEIEKLIAAGWLERPANQFEATRAWGPADVHEAVRRGLIR